MEDVPTGISMGNFLHNFPCHRRLSVLSRSAYLSERPFTLFVWFLSSLTLSVFPYLFYSLSLSSCHSFLPASAVNLAHICPPVVLYHLVCLGLTLFLSRPPASCFTPYSIPPSLSPSVCCQNLLRQSQMLSLLGSIFQYISLSLSLSLCLLINSLPFCPAFLFYFSTFGLTFSFNRSACPPPPAWPPIPHFYITLLIFPFFIYSYISVNVIAVVPA